MDAARRAAAIALAAALSGCAGGDGPDGPSVLLVTVDTTRADHLGAYGYPFGTTPFLDRLAAEGVVFEAAYAPMPQTLPSHATMMTGLPPRAHGALENARSLGEEHATLAETLAARGWHTAAFIGALVLDASTGITRGFEHVDLPKGERRGRFLTAERQADAVTDKVLGWAHGRDDPDRPAFAWVHYYDPHGPFEPPRHKTPPLARRPIVEHVTSMPQFADGTEPELAADIGRFWHAYGRELAFMDSQIERLVETLRGEALLEDLVVLVVGDHGEGLYEHGVKAHGIAVFEEQMRVPWIVHGAPGVPPGTRVRVPVGLERLMPTVLEIATGEARPGGLWSTLRAGRRPRPEPIFVERPHYDDGTATMRHIPHGQRGVLAAVVHEDFKLLRTPEGETLFHLGEDPDELVDASARHPEVAERMRALLDEWLRAHPVDPARPEDISAERREVLEALGYLGGGAER